MPFSSCPLTLPAVSSIAVALNSSPDWCQLGQSPQQCPHAGCWQHSSSQCLSSVFTGDYLAAVLHERKLSFWCKFPHFYIFSGSTRPCFLQAVLAEVLGTWTEIGFLLSWTCSISFHQFLKNFLLIFSQDFRICSRLMLYLLYVSESDTKTFLQHIPNRNRSEYSQQRNYISAHHKYHWPLLNDPYYCLGSIPPNS